MKPIVWRVPQEPRNQQRRIWKKPGSHTRAYSGNANVKEPNAAKRERGRTPLIETSHHHRKRAKSSIASDHRRRAPPSGPATRIHVRAHTAWYGQYGTPVGLCPKAYGYPRTYHCSPSDGVRMHALLHLVQDGLRVYRAEECYAPRMV